LSERKKFKKGIMKDELLREKILHDVLEDAAQEGFVKYGTTNTDVNNDKKNIEYLILFKFKSVNNGEFYDR
jgi:predicted rRNA methylase YqxC with S4 and FtsJ domains